ncbi:Zinc finger protein-likeSTOP1 [Orchesella cincta]|uniref:Zinc finger protein-likeSTOP1 n=1 Tax=Orchesella cincta TaxID=48709 RepID=A0A1D2N8J6_ORCCI|nr:Zinc finger protein-likeSTOP1 [Orchesella cincta]
MFAIVELTAERACEVVPKTWIRHNKCAWPSSNDPAKIRNLVNKSKPPKKSWKHHDYKVLSEYETYELALENIDTFMRDSDLSDFETAKKKKKTSMLCFGLVSNPIVPAAVGSTYEPDDNDVFLEPMTPHLHLVNPNGADSIEQSNTSPNTPVVVNCIDPTPVVTGIAEIKLTLKQILDILQNLSERIEKLENSEGGKTTALVEDALDGTVFNLPITSQELLKDLEDDLSANQMRKQQLIQFFYYKGGSSILEALKS